MAVLEEPTRDPQERFQEIVDELHDVFIRKEWLRNNGLADSPEMGGINREVEMLNKEKRGMVNDVDFSLIRYGPKEINYV